jgi:hypothetical protein
LRNHQQSKKDADRSAKFFAHDRCLPMQPEVQEPGV